MKKTNYANNYLARTILHVQAIQTGDMDLLEGVAGDDEASRLKLLVFGVLTETLLDEALKKVVGAMRVAGIEPEKAAQVIVILMNEND